SAALLLAFSGVGTDIVFKQLGEKSNGLVVSQIVPFPTTSAIPLVREYQSVGKSRGSSDFTHLGLWGHVSARMMVEALKKTGRDARVLPRTVIYDPELTLSLPVMMSVTSGLNAIAHAAEGLYAQDSNPVMDLMAEEGIRALAQALPLVRQHSGDIDARGDALYGAWLCGSVLGNVGMALHHKLCHTLGGSFNLPHAEVHTVVLPQAIAFNATAAPKAMTRIERALGVTGKVSAAAGLFDLAANNGAPVALRDIGMKESDLDRAAHIAVSNPYWNPRPLGAEQRSDIRDLLHRAYEGVRPD
ncbi:MAG: iron-containing alcohol dehydrogenase, partial [Chloroflexota bacterium]